MLSRQILKAIENSPYGITSLDILESLRLCDRNTLKTTLSRLVTKKYIIRIKRGVYSTNPIKDIFAYAQALFGGYIGFSSALYIHHLITEMPFTIYIVTKTLSKTSEYGNFTIKAVALKEKAIGFETKNGYVVSTIPKTLFDILYLPRYSIPTKKLEKILKNISDNDRDELKYYIKKFAPKLMKKVR